MNGDRKRQEQFNMRKYAKMLQEADHEKVRLANEVTELSRANYELQLQLDSFQNPEADLSNNELKRQLE